MGLRLEIWMRSKRPPSRSDNGGLRASTLDLRETMKILKELKNLADPAVAEHSQRFFKTGPGEYGEGDVFLGIRVPVLRQVAKQYGDLKLSDIQKLLRSPYHEVRSTVVIILVNQYAKAADDVQREKVYQFYIKNFKCINNWDLVDVSSHKIVGRHLYNRDRRILYKWAQSEHLWTRRIAIISTMWFISKNDYSDSLKLSKILLNDEHDLIHKAVGWVLREVGKKDRGLLEKFLKKYHTKMPRTMLRYAIEKLPETRRQQYIRGTI